MAEAKVNQDAGSSITKVFSALKLDRPALKSKKSDDVSVPISKNEMFYKMTHDRRGYAVIFNHTNFDSRVKRVEGFESREPGTLVDCRRLVKTFRALGFEVIVRDDAKLTVAKVESTLNEVSKMSFAKCDCLVIVVLSHGCMDKILAYDSWYPTDLLVEMFTPDKCPSLAGKPKILILDLCQQRKRDRGCTVRVEVDGNDVNGNERTRSYRLPLYADFLVACSTVNGYVSYHDCTGSCYVKALCTILDKHAWDMDLLAILTCVNRLVATDFEAAGAHKMKQMPCYTSMLTRLLQFRPN